MSTILPVELLETPWKSSGIVGSWLTVNRACNLRCGWCYAAGTEFSKHLDMNLDIAMRLVLFLKSLGVKSIVLIGGEPTIYPHLFTLAHQIVESNINLALVTNGLQLANSTFCEKLHAVGLSNVTISLKGGSDSEYERLTGVRGFSRVMQGLKNLKDLGIEALLEFTVAKDHLENLEKTLLTLIEHEIGHITIDLAGPVVCGDAISANGIPTPFELRDVVHRIHSCLKDSGIDYVIYMTIPFCLIDRDVLYDLRAHDRIVSSCHVPRGDALVFDEKARVLICNHITSYPIGQFGVDFSGADKFWEFWNDQERIRLRRTCSCYPAKQCIECAYWNECGGGCIIKWLYWNPSEFIPGITKEERR
jgi:radical SAM protein with 4Fe4S-binding SPASM domain